MKKILICSLVFMVLAGCSKSDTVLFCEGVDVDGKGVSCGKKFSTGDITGVVKQSKPFETDLLEMKIFRIEKNRKTVEKSIHLKVERDKSIANTPLAFYNSGKYVVELYRESDKIASGEIEVTDNY